MSSQKTTTVSDEVLDFLISSPTPQQIVDFQASEAAQARLRYLLERKRSGTLTAEENAEMEEMSHLNHFVVLLKARAHKALMNRGVHS
jgi:hypothetical protein